MALDANTIKRYYAVNDRVLRVELPVTVHADANGNGDDVFRASRIRRRVDKRHGYVEPGSDERAYNRANTPEGDEPRRRIPSDVDEGARSDDEIERRLLDEPPPMTPDDVKRTGTQFGQRISGREAKRISSLLVGWRGRPSVVKKREERGLPPLKEGTGDTFTVVHDAKHAQVIKQRSGVGYHVLERGTWNRVKNGSYLDRDEAIERANAHRPSGGVHEGRTDVPSADRKSDRNGRKSPARYISFRNNLPDTDPDELAQVRDNVPMGTVNRRGVAESSRGGRFRSVMHQTATRLAEQNSDDALIGYHDSAIDAITRIVDALEEIIDGAAHPSGIVPDHALQVKTLARQLEDIADSIERTIEVSVTANVGS